MVDSEKDGEYEGEDSGEEDNNGEVADYRDVISCSGDLIEIIQKDIFELDPDLNNDIEEIYMNKKYYKVTAKNGEFFSTNFTDFNIKCNFESIIGAGIFCTANRRVKIFRTEFPENQKTAVLNAINYYLKDKINEKDYVINKKDKEGKNLEIIIANPFYKPIVQDIDFGRVDKFDPEYRIKEKTN